MMRREPAATVASGVQNLITAMVLQAYCLTRGEASQEGRSVPLTASRLVARRRTYYHEAVVVTLRGQPGKAAEPPS